MVTLSIESHSMTTFSVSSEAVAVNAKTFASFGKRLLKSPILASDFLNLSPHDFTHLPVNPVFDVFRCNKNKLNFPIRYFFLALWISLRFSNKLNL